MADILTKKAAVSQNRKSRINNLITTDQSPLITKPYPFILYHGTNNHNQYSKKAGLFRKAVQLAKAFEK
jgi:hypothetical protein